MEFLLRILVVNFSNSDPEDTEWKYLKQYDLV